MNYEQIKKEKIKRLKNWSNGKKQPPVRIDLEPTFGCNLKCKFCWQRSDFRLKQCNYSNPLTEERILKLVKEAADLGVLEWQIAGGWEPMIKPNFALNLMQAIKKYNMYGCLTTNGTLFTENIINELVKINWDQILFSLEGPNAQIHDYLTGKKGSFEKSVRAMSLFNKYKKLYNKKLPNYSFHTVLTNMNYKYLPEMVKWGHKLGCCGVVFEPLNVWSDDGEKIKLTDRQLSELPIYLKKAIKIAEELHVPTNLQNLLDKNLLDKSKMDRVIMNDIKLYENNRNAFLNVPCYDFWLNLEIRADGHVVPCRLCDSHQYANKIHNKPLQEIWYGPYFERVRKKMLDKKLPRYCKTCAAGVILETRKLRKEMNRSWF
jgi:MoaA/NifB/PqqE/SkfB family radical SAM enzyme